MAIHIIGVLVRDFLATDVPLPEKQLRARTDYSALRASPVAECSG
jgi:hypothetical protein